MDIFTLISFLGGLALFLFGMATLSNSLEKASEGRLEGILEKLTDNIFKATLLGALVTAAIQSSGATTVVVVGLVNAKVLKLRQAIGIIMGANIGTTITAHLLRLTDISGTSFILQLIKPNNLAPLLAAIGIVLWLGSKKDSLKDAGTILLGFGVLFAGMFQMEAAVKPLSESPEFAHLFATMSNPILGVIVGAVVTAMLQSSSASVGILQALSSTGVLSYATAIPIILGQNIGTCSTPLMASIGASKNAKRSAFVHLCFNVTGTVIFLILLYIVRIAVPPEVWMAPIDKGGIANFHTVFNLTITLIFLPLAGQLEKLAYKVIPQGKEEDVLSNILLKLDERLLVSPGLAIQHARDAVHYMADVAMENFKYARETIENEPTPALAEKIHQNEDLIDQLQDKIENYAVKIGNCHLTEKGKQDVSEIFHMISEFERIGDQCENILEAAQMRKTPYSETGKSDMHHLFSAVSEILHDSMKSYKKEDYSRAHRVEPLEQVIDVLEAELKSRHISRLRDGKCSIDGAFSFVEAASCLERIADHCSNIAVFLITVKEYGEDFDTHAYLHSLHKGSSEEYKMYYSIFEKKYLSIGGMQLDSFEAKDAAHKEETAVNEKA